MTDRRPYILATLELQAQDEPDGIKILKATLVVDTHATNAQVQSALEQVAQRLSTDPLPEPTPKEQQHE